MMKKYVLTAMLIFAVVASVSAQSPTEKRRIKTTALQVYENYKVTLSSLYSKDNYTEDNFMALFGDNTELYNDIIPVNTPTQLSPYKYFTQFRANIRRIYPEFNKLSLGEPVSVGGKWQIKCHFSRAARFRTLNEMKYPRWTFDYTMTIEMDKRYDDDKKVYQEALITAIEVDKPLGKYFVIEKQPDFSIASKSGKDISDWDEEYQSRIFPENEWKISDIQISENNKHKNFFEVYTSRLTKNPLDAHFYNPKNQKFTKNIFGIGIHYSPLFLENEMSKDFKNQFSSVSLNSKALSLSSFFGKHLTHSDKGILFFNAGLDVNMYFFNYKGEHLDTLSYAATDDDGDDYTRKIKINSLQENVTNISVSVPLSVEYLLQLTQNEHPIFVSFKTGAFAELALSLSGAYKLNADYIGNYTFQFGDKESNVEFDHYYDFGKDLNKSGNSAINLSRFNYGFLCGAGFWFALNSNNLLKLELLYKHGFCPPLRYNKNFDLISKGKDGNDNPDVYNSLLHTKDQGLRNLYVGLSFVRTIGGR